MPRGVFVRTPEHRAKIAEASRKRIWTPEQIERHKAKWSAGLVKARASWKDGRSPRYGTHLSDEQKQHLSRIFAGRRPVTSPEIRQKIANALRGRPNPYAKGNKSHLWKHGLSYTREYIRQMKKRRTAFERGGGLLSTKTVQLVYEDNIKKYGTLTCIYCLIATPFGKDTLEHKKPLSRGGTNDYENLAVACLRCNSRKRSMLYEEFVQLLQRQVIAPV